MALKVFVINVPHGTTATPVSDSNAAPIDGHLRLKNTGTTSLLLGGPDLTGSTNGWTLAAGDQIDFDQSDTDTQASLLLVPSGTTDGQATVIRLSATGTV